MFKAFEVTIATTFFCILASSFGSQRHTVYMWEEESLHSNQKLEELKLKSLQS